jgi:hypothetical protein
MIQINSENMNILYTRYESLDGGSVSINFSELLLYYSHVTLKDVTVIVTTYSMALEEQ